MLRLKNYSNPFRISTRGRSKGYPEDDLFPRDWLLRIVNQERFLRCGEILLSSRAIFAVALKMRDQALEFLVVGLEFNQALRIYQRAGGLA